MLKQDAVLKLMESLAKVRALELATPESFAREDSAQIAVLNGEIAKWEIKAESMKDDADIHGMILGKIAILQERMLALQGKDYVKMAQTANFDVLYDLAYDLAEELGFVDVVPQSVESAQDVKRKASYKFVNDRLYAPDGSGEIVGFITGNKNQHGESMCAIAGWALPVGHAMRLDGWLVGYLAGDGLFVKAVTSSNKRIDGKQTQITRISHLLGDCDAVWQITNRAGVNTTPFSQNVQAVKGRFMSADEISKLDVMDVR